MTLPYSDIYEDSRKAQRAWSKLSLPQRLSVLKNVIPFLKKSKEDLVKLIHSDVKKPIFQASQEVELVINETELELDDALEALSSVITLRGGTETEMLYSPLGTSLIISTWNSPLYLLHFQCLVSLLAGNSVIFKPSEKCSNLNKLYYEIFSSKLPENLFQLVEGDDDVGQSLVERSPDLISFTGSLKTGLQITQSLFKNKITRIILELGGKGFLLVLEDADLEAAADFAIQNSFRHAGQVCIATEVVIVHDSVSKDFERIIIDKMRNDKRFNPNSENDLFGPVIDESSVEQWETLVKESVDQGGEILFGGKHKEMLLEPTIIKMPDLESPILKKEYFSPLLSLVTFKTVSSVLDWENGLSVGLGGSIFSLNVESAVRVARAMGTAMIGINRGAAGPHGTPFVGAKDSGLSFYRSKEGHRNFAQMRIINSKKIN